MTRKPRKRVSDSTTAGVANEMRFHPAANIFPLLEGAEFDALVEDIKQHGLRERITTYGDQIIDGRNRARACKQAGIKAKYRSFQGEPDDIPAFIISANIHRRHLSAEQKRDFLSALLKLHPDKSNRQIAKLAKVDDKTVASARAEAERRAEIPHADKRVDAKGRQQPAKKKPRRVTTILPLARLRAVLDDARQPRPTAFSGMQASELMEISGYVDDLHVIVTNRDRAQKIAESNEQSNDDDCDGELVYSTKS